MIERILNLYLNPSVSSSSKTCGKEKDQAWIDVQSDALLCFYRDVQNTIRSLLISLGSQFARVDFLE